MKVLHLRLIMLLVLTCCLAFSATIAWAEDIGTVNAKVVLRKEADKESKALQTLPKGEEVTLLSVSGKWYKVSYGKYTGYVMKKYVDVSSSSVVANSSAIEKLGDAPAPCRSGDTGDDVKKLQSALKTLGFYNGRIDGDYGKGTTEAVTKFQAAQKLDADGIAGKDTIKAIFGSVGKTKTSDSPKKATSTTTPKNGSDPVKNDDMKGIDSIADIGSAPAASKEGDSGTKVKKLQQALKVLGYYTGSIDGSYGDGTVKAVKRFQKNRGMKQDGIAGSSTINVLFNTGKSSASSTTKKATVQKTYKTEVLDWFDDNVSKVIPKGARFTIMDVKTGKRFEAVRWSGSNHLDAEPRTSDDTSTMKSIFGGSWSWRRRAVLILYDDHVYAASMNGMPHGTTTISNDFDGHFCIHFKNSKTHGTKKVDDDHQTCISQAAKATWK